MIDYLCEVSDEDDGDDGGTIFMELESDLRRLYRIVSDGRMVSGGNESDILKMEGLLKRKMGRDFVMEVYLELEYEDGMARLRGEEV